MKLIKKICIGSLALIICFCSCFKFVNAETQTVYAPLTSPFNLIVGNYYLFVDSESADAESSFLVFFDQSEIISGYARNLDQTFEGQDVYLEIITPNTYYEIPLIYEFRHNQNGYNYYVYSFEITLTNQDFQGFYFDDDVSSFITTNTDSSVDYSVYNTIYELIETYIFGGSITGGSHQDLTATILSSIICVLVFALPFLIIWKVIKVIMG